MKEYQCPKCRNHFPREGLVIMKGLGICIGCSKGNSGIVRKIPEKRYNRNVPKTNIADKNREIGISPRLARFLKENGYKKTAFGVYRKLGNGVTEVHYYQNFDELERRFEKVLSKKAEESSTSAEDSTSKNKKNADYEYTGGVVNLLSIAYDDSFYACVENYKNYNGSLSTFLEGHILSPVDQMGV